MTRINTELEGGKKDVPQIHRLVPLSRWKIGWCLDLLSQCKSPVNRTSEPAVVGSGSTLALGSTLFGLGHKEANLLELELPHSPILYRQQILQPASIQGGLHRNGFVRIGESYVDRPSGAVDTRHEGSLKRRSASWPKEVAKIVHWTQKRTDFGTRSWMERVYHSFSTHQFSAAGDLRAVWPEWWPSSREHTGSWGCRGKVAGALHVAGVGPVSEVFGFFLDIVSCSSLLRFSITTEHEGVINRRLVWSWFWDARKVLL